MSAVLLVGPHGVVGSAIADRLGGDGEWQVTTASRRRAEEGGRHISVDLLDAAAAQAAFGDLAHVTHLVFAAYVERPTMAETVGPNVAMLANTLDALRAARAPLQRVVLIGGGKSYGEHLGPYKTPAKESDPRFLGPIFYNDQEDLLADRARADGFAWTVLRPDAVIGFNTGSPMNLLNGIAVFAALSKDAGVPLRFPGSAGAWTALHQATDADLLAAAAEWALTGEGAAGEIFNVTNGDLFRWQHLWTDIADVFEMPTAPPQPMSLSDQMADKRAAWDGLVERHHLRPVPYDQIVSWPFADGVWNAGYDMVQSTIKIRRAGFAGCVDSHESIVDHLARLRRLRYVP
ncbi:SDR family oxidoreductase [Actinomadura sp. NEAU-AAG7]|uniref:SDR family oxidoreductase n=1 Tax=Actinomadura sp. NEAU-AAG7 TaxID=2839640 RepID=UPI001BE4DDCC|nr:SDR family oxidoreductase [Actinomadura sp. NEAU-AAG7]MBT2209294.1 SDR family oxidoreductase [Actinomadura sp. NEAU-AAG7]